MVAAYAGWGQRVGAYLIDGLCVLPFSLIGLFLGQGTDEVTGQTTMNALYPIFVYLFPFWDAKKQTLADKIVSTVVTR
jgi:uncharacterized RDD family membrane protein YckC